MAADGGTSLSDLKVLRDQPELFGTVASDPTAWRVLDSIDAVAGVLRPGNGRSNTAADRVAVLDDALAQLPVKTKKLDPDGGEWMLARSDSAGATHGIVDALR